MNFFRKKADPDLEKEILSKYFISKGFKRNGEFSDQDIFIAGFPKTGNTWMQHLMSGILYGCNMSHVHNNLVRELVPDVHQFSFYKRYNERMAFKTHFLPKREYRNVIVLVRDGRDALTSFYKMEEGRGKSITFEDIVYKNKGLISSWGEFLTAWKENPFHAKLIYVKYENLISEPFEELKKVCLFFGIDISDALLKEIISNCSFASMRKKEESIYWEKMKDWQENRFFVRKGQAGSYKTEMPEALIKYFEEHNADLIREYGYKIE